MKKRILEKIKEELKIYIEEGVVLDIDKKETGEEKFEFCGYDEEIMEMNVPTNRKWKRTKPAAAVVLGLSLVLGLSGVTRTNMAEPNPYVAEAAGRRKKDCKKPVIKFKDGNIKEAEQGKKIKNLGATAKDNKDGNVTKKIKVTVKRKKKNYKTIAKKIEKNKSVEFKDLGEYTLTYTVADKAGNKTIKKRKIKVVKPKGKDPVITTTEIPTTQNNITEVPTTKEVTTETPTTEKVTTETPTTEKPYVFKELPEPIVGDNTCHWHSIKLNNEIYYIVNDPDWKTSFDSFFKTEDCFPENRPQIKINIQNDYEYIMLQRDSGQIGNGEYLKYIGGISAKNENGEILTPYDDMTIYSPFNKNNVKNGSDNVVYIYIQGSAADPNDIVMVPIYLNIVEFDKNKNYDENSFNDQGYELLNKEPLVYGKRRSYSKVNSSGTPKIPDAGIAGN